jgi:hypothetical protein
VDVATSAMARSELQKGSLDVALSVGAHAAVDGGARVGRLLPGADPRTRAASPAAGDRGRRSSTAGARRSRGPSRHRSRRWRPCLWRPGRSSPRPRTRPPAMWPRWPRASCCT